MVRQRIRVQGVGSRHQDLRSRVHGSEFRINVLDYRVEGVVFKVDDVGYGRGCRVSGSRVWGVKIEDVVAIGGVPQAPWW